MFEAPQKETLEGIEAFEQGEYERALQLFKGAAKKRAQSAFALRDVGHAAFHLQDFTSAMDYYQKALKADKNLLDVHFNSGLILMKRGQFQDAMEGFRQTLRLVHPLVPGGYYLGLFHNPDSLALQCRLNLGTLFKERGELELAL